MIKRETVRFYYFIIGLSGYLVPRPENGTIKISKTIHPYLLGKRKMEYLYNLEKSMYGIRATLEVLKNIIADGGDVLFVNNSLILKNIFFKESQIECVKWKRTAIKNSRKVDLMLLSDVEKEIIVEAYRKDSLLVGVGSSTMSKISYPFNLNTESSVLLHWFISTLYTICTKGKSINKIKKSLYPCLLGESSAKITLEKSKKITHSNEI